MQPAFFAVLAFPPPASGADVFVCFDGAGAGFAAYARVALEIQGVERDVVGLRVCPDIVFFPVENGVELGDVAAVVGFFEIQFAAGCRLAAALSGQPGGGVFQGAVERLDFADVAATAAQLDAVVHGGCAEFLLKLPRAFGIGVEDFQLGLVTDVDGGNQGGGFGIEFAGVEGDDAQGEFQAADGVGNDHVFDGKAGGEDGLRIAAGDVFEAGFERGGQLGQPAPFDFACRRDAPKLGTEEGHGWLVPWFLFSDDPSCGKRGRLKVCTEHYCRAVSREGERMLFYFFITKAIAAGLSVRGGSRLCR